MTTTLKDHDLEHQLLPSAELDRICREAYLLNRTAPEDVTALIEHCRAQAEIIDTMRQFLRNHQ